MTTPVYLVIWDECPGCNEWKDSRKQACDSCWAALPIERKRLHYGLIGKRNKSSKGVFA